MKYILATFRALLLAVSTIILVIVLFILSLLLGLFGKKFATRVLHIFSTFIGFILRLSLGIRVKIINREKMPKQRGFLMVSNHMGYVELAALLKIGPIAFAAKDEIAHWPVLGAVSKAVGTVFIDRDSGGMSEKLIKKISEVIDNKVNFWFAPEKTTTDGTWLRPFSSALFVVANQIKCPVVPTVFVIKKLNGKPITKKQRIEVAWALDDQGGNTPLMKHVGHFLTFWSVQVEMHVLDPLIPDYDDANIEERRAFSHHVHELMADALEKHEPDFDRERTEL